jgi:hypothetical protein
LKRHLLSLLLVIGYSLVQSVASPLDVTIVYDNQVSTVNSGRVNDPDFPVFLMHADSFSLSASALINQVNWLGAYKDGNQLPDGDDNFTVFLFAFGGGIPQTIPLATFSVGPAERQLTMQSLPASGIPVFAYAAPLPNTQLAAGTYLIAIMNDPVDSDRWLWANAEGINPGESYLMLFEGTPWQKFSGVGVAELAFSISRVPEPTEAVLLSCGFLMIGLCCALANRRRVSGIQ